MNGEVDLVFTLSKEAMKLVKSGEAVLESGGIRRTTGEFLELAKPAVKSAGKNAVKSAGKNAIKNVGKNAIKGVSGNISSPVTMVSSLAGNVQNAFIQHGVNQANGKLDVSLEKLDQLQTSVDALLKAGSWGWVSSAVGLVNCGISVAGFYMTLQKMDKLSDQLSRFETEYQQNVLSDELEKARRIELSLHEDLAILTEQTSIGMNKRAIVDNLNEATGFLEKIIDKFLNQRIEGQIGCCLIYSLSILYMQVVRAFSARCYYEDGKFPVNYDDWTNIPNIINSDDFKKCMKQFFCMTITKCQWKRNTLHMEV